MKITISPSACHGMGLCERICPQVFRLQDGVACVVKKSIPQSAWPLCREAARNCPTRSIRIEE